MKENDLLDSDEHPRCSRGNINAVSILAAREPIEEDREGGNGAFHPPRHPWTPTLRRVSLLNTLLFLGLALSNTKIQAHASPGAINTQSTPLNTRSGTEQQVPTTTRFHGDETPQETQINVAATEEDEAVDRWLEVIEDHEAQDDAFEEGREEDGDAQPLHEEQDDGIILVATVDGTIAAIQSSTGELLWKKDGKASKAKQRDQKSGNEKEDVLKLPRDDLGHKQSRELSRLFYPLTTTTTTASSASDSSIMAAIPSINGHVFLTTTDPSKDPRTTPNARTRTEMASLKDLVERAPYVDSSGRFYLGSVESTAVAIDSKTGEILYVASANGDSDEGNSDPEWEDRSVVWLGRVDYSVSIYNGKSSAKEVQFSASEIMSVNDMVTAKRKPRHDPMFLGAASEMPPNLCSAAGEDFLDEEAEPDEADLFQFSALVATPSGNLAYRNPNTGKVEWVADEVFDSPIAYAVHSSSGKSLHVDIIPDVTMPSHSKEYLTREIERQIELTLGDGSETHKEPDNRNSVTRENIQPSIVGTLSNGQLYSMPLGRRYQSTLPSHSSLATQHVVVDDMGGPRHQAPTTSISLAPFREIHALPNRMPLPGRLPSVPDARHQNPNHACGPSSSIFPRCLFKAVQQRVVGSLKATRKRDDQFHDIDVAQVLTDDSTAVIETHSQIPFEQQIPDSPDNFRHHHQHRQRNYRKMLKILGSWLPPTIALLFVVSFELGRRKRQKDGLDILQQVANSNGFVDEHLRALVEQKGNSNPQEMIQITDEVLGFGGHGTVVFRGMLEGRNVAVKRMLKTYLASADREISLLIESDGHPNVVRYFLKEVKGDFVYLALELCDLSLHSLIGTLVSKQNGSQGDTNGSALTERVSSAARKLLLQIATGVSHLHSLRIVHNDLKPANILLALSKEVKSTVSGTSNESIYETFQKENYVAKISDMGLGKMLAGQSSFGASASFRGQSSTVHSNGNVGIGPGTVGWMAPEAMRIKSNPSVASEASNSGDASPLERPTSNTRASRSVDIFSLGCIFYSTLVPGYHPFGDWYEREANIMHNRPFIEPLRELSVEAYDLVAAMIQHNPRSRPTAKQICEHPFFWSTQRRLSFLCDLSDRLENDAATVDNAESLDATGFQVQSLAIERNASKIVGFNWEKALYKGFTEQRYRTYDPTSIRDLLRLLRNKKNHFQDLELSVRQKIGSDTEGLMKYFQSCFPELLMHCYKVCCEILPLNDPIVETYMLTSASYPASYTFLTPRIVKALPAVLLEEPQCVSQEELSQGESALVTAAKSEVAPTLEQTTTPDFISVNEEKPIDIADEGSTGEEDKIVLEETKNETCPSTESAAEPEEQVSVQDGIVLWEGSTAARKLNCRGWIRSDEEWTNCAGMNRKKNAILLKCAQDPKFRTRLCNHWDESMGEFCPMRKKNKCVFAHGPVELRVKEGKVGRWGKLVDKNGNNSNPNASGGEDTYGAARSIESTRKVEGKWNSKKGSNGIKKQASNKKKSKAN